MTYIYLIIAGAIGIWLGYKFAPRKAKNPEEAKEPTQFETKKENKEKILQFFKGKEKVVNNDIEKLLGVSDATATRYLDELEKEGKITQHGETGQSVFYSLKS